MQTERERLEAAGRWLREQRERKGFATAGKFARAIDADPSLVSRIEAGASKATDERAAKIAEVLELDEVEVRRHLGLWVPDEADPAEPVKWTRSQIESVLAALRERRGSLKSPAVVAEVDEAIRLLELARTRELRQEMIAYGEVRSRTA